MHACFDRTTATLTGGRSHRAVVRCKTAGVGGCAKVQQRAVRVRLRPPALTMLAAWSWAPHLAHVGGRGGAGPAEAWLQPSRGAPKRAGIALDNSLHGRGPAPGRQSRQLRRDPVLCLSRRSRSNLVQPALFLPVSKSHNQACFSEASAYSHHHHPSLHHNAFFGRTAPSASLKQQACKLHAGCRPEAPPCGMARGLAVPRWPLAQAVQGAASRP